MKKGTLFRAIGTFIPLAIAIFAISSLFVFNNFLIWPAFLGLGVVNLIIMRFLKIRFRVVYPDMIFGVIDNGILVIAASIGSVFAGVAGAVIGGVTGNTITDGVGGFFEGYISENQKRLKIDNLRTSLSTMLGKMTGCLFGAGAMLALIWWLRLIWFVV